MLTDEITTQSEKLFKQPALQLSKNRTQFTEWWRASRPLRSPAMGQALCHGFLPMLRFPAAEGIQAGRSGWICSGPEVVIG